MGGYRSDSTGSEYGPVTCSYEPSGTIKRRKFLQQLSAFRLSKDSALIRSALWCQLSLISRGGHVSNHTRYIRDVRTTEVVLYTSLWVALRNSGSVFKNFHVFFCRDGSQFQLSIGCLKNCYIAINC